MPDRVRARFGFGQAAGRYATHPRRLEDGQAVAVADATALADAVAGADDVAGANDVGVADDVVVADDVAVADTVAVADAIEEGEGPVQVHKVIDVDILGDTPTGYAMVGLVLARALIVTYHLECKTTISAS